MQRVSSECISGEHLMSSYRDDYDGCKQPLPSEERAEDRARIKELERTLAKARALATEFEETLAEIDHDDPDLHSLDNVVDRLQELLK